MVTGASSGMGFETALALATPDAHVILACRDRDRGEDALRRIRAHSAGASVELLLADLSSQRSIRELADRFRTRHDRLHVLVNNAGVGQRRRRLSADGLETTFAVNHMGYFLLTLLLLKALRASAPARIVNVASEVHRRGRIDFGDLQLERGYSQYRAYANSKLANMLFTYELARRLADSGVAANCLHPGMVATEIWREAPWLARKLLRLVLKSPAAGAATAIYVAGAPQVAGVSGKYFVDRKQAESSAASRDAELARRLWQASERLVAS